MFENINWRSFRTILYTSLKVDLSGSVLSDRAGTSSSGLSPFLRLCIFMSGFSALLNLLMALTLLQTQEFPVSKIRLFGNLNLFIPMFAVPFYVFLNEQSGLMNPEEAEVIAPRPVSSDTYFLAKNAEMYVFGSIMTLSFAVIPAFMGLFVSGGGFLFLLSFLISSLLGVFFVTGCFTLLYAVCIRFTPYSVVQGVITVLQFLMPILLFLSVGFAVMAVKDTDGENFIKVFASFAYLSPTALFFSLPMLATGNGLPIDGYYAINALLLTGLFMWIPTILMRKIYSEYLNRNVNQGSGRRRKTGRGFLSRLFCRSGVERGAFDFFYTVCLNDRRVFRQLLLYAGMVIGYMLLMDGPDRFAHVSVLGPMVWPVIILYQVVEVSEDWRGRWVMEMAPLSAEQKGEFLSGTIKASLVTYLFPVLALTEVFLLFKKGFAIKDVALFLGLVISITPFLTLMFAIQFPAFPFTKNTVKGIRVGVFKSLLLLLIGIVMFVAVLAHMLIFYLDPLFFLGVSLVLTVALPLWFFMARALGTWRFRDRRSYYE